MTSLLSTAGAAWPSWRSTTRTTTSGLELAGAGASPSSSLAPSSSGGATGSVPLVAKVPGQSARAALDAKAAAAARDGMQVVYDTAQPGRIVDMRSLDPEELAAIANGTGATFSHDERIWAQGELSHRVALTLEGLDSGDPGDVRAYQMGVKVLYGQMSPDVRKALGWTPQMLQMTDKLITEGSSRYGQLEEKEFWERFLEGLRKDGALHLSPVDLRS